MKLIQSISLRDCGVAVGVFVVFFGLQAIVIDEPAQVKITTDLDLAVLRCLPQTLDEKTIMSIEEREAGLYLQCQKHEQIPYGTAPRTPPMHYTMLIGKQ